MYIWRRTQLIATLFLLAPTMPGAETGDPWGHWKGTLQAPGQDLTFEVDLAKNSSGEFAGTISVPAQKIQGLPLAKVTVEGRTIRFHARTDQKFQGELQGDGKSISGEMSIEDATLPFSLTRTGDARVEEPPRSGAIAKEIEGKWSGAIEGKGGRQIRLVLTMNNRPDGTATGSFVNVDEGGLVIPVTIAQQGSRLRLENHDHLRRMISSARNDDFHGSESAIT